MGLRENFISCDWGTSNFRLRHINCHTLDVLSEHRTDMGIKKCFQLFQAQQKVSQEHFFGNYLTSQIEKLDRSVTKDSLIIASGMLSSSIGMHELPYTEMPISFNGKEIISKEIFLEKDRRLLLISGAKTQNDVMRGEEIQAIGLSHQLPDQEKGILLLPGTHSKHLYFDKGRFIDFNTHMTGELYEIISRHSILAPSLLQTEWNSKYEESFLKGVVKGVANEQMTVLFSIRANSLLHGVSAQENAYFLSGLLVGAELANLKNKSEKVYLAATDVQHELYKLALESFLPLSRVVCFEANIIEKALLIGQNKILKTYG